MAELPLISTTNRDNVDWLQKAYPDMREDEMAFGASYRPPVKHMGPGPHPSGSPQTVHGKPGGEAAWQAENVETTEREIWESGIRQRLASHTESGRADAIVIDYGVDHEYVEELASGIEKADALLGGPLPRRICFFVGSELNYPNTRGAYHPHTMTATEELKGQLEFWHCDNGAQVRMTLRESYDNGVSSKFTVGGLALHEWTHVVTADDWDIRNEIPTYRQMISPYGDPYEISEKIGRYANGSNLELVAELVASERPNASAFATKKLFLEMVNSHYDRMERYAAKHGGPGPHPGTGTPQTVHGSGRIASSSDAPDEQRMPDSLRRQLKQLSQDGDALFLIQRGEPDLRKVKEFATPAEAIAWAKKRIEGKEFPDAAMGEGPHALWVPASADGVLLEPSMGEAMDGHRKVLTATVRGYLKDEDVTALVDAAEAAGYDTIEMLTEPSHDYYWSLQSRMRAAMRRGEVLPTSQKDDYEGTVWYLSNNFGSVGQGSKYIPEGWQPAQGLRSKLADVYEKLSVGSVWIHPLADGRNIDDTFAGMLQARQELKLAGIAKVNFWPDPEGEGGRTRGTYHDASTVVDFFKMANYEEGAKALERNDGWLAWPSQQGIGYHEYAHGVHMQSVAHKSGWTRNAVVASVSPWGDWIRKNVSAYAATNDLEFVAELFASRQPTPEVAELRSIVRQAVLTQVRSDAAFKQAEKDLSKWLVTNRPHLATNLSQWAGEGAAKHGGPGPHEGTGTQQNVHGESDIDSVNGVGIEVDGNCDRSYVARLKKALVVAGQKIPGRAALRKVVIHAGPFSPVYHTTSTGSFDPQNQVIHFWRCGVQYSKEGDNMGAAWEVTKALENSFNAFSLAHNDVESMVLHEWAHARTTYVTLNMARAAEFWLWPHEELALNGQMGYLGLGSYSGQSAHEFIAETISSQRIASPWEAARKDLSQMFLDSMQGIGSGRENELVLAWYNRHFGGTSGGNMTTTKQATEAELLRLLEMDAAKHLPGQHDQLTHGRDRGGPEEGPWTQRMRNAAISTGKRHRAMDHYSDEYKVIMEQWARAVGLDHDEIVDRVTKDLADFKAKNPQKYEEYRNWYRQAHAEVTAAADRTGVTVEQMAAMTSVCSIKTPWEANIASTESFVAWYRKNPTITLDLAEVERVAKRSHRPDFLELTKGQDGVSVKAWDVDPLLVVASKELNDKDCKAKYGVKRTTAWTEGFGKAAQIMRGADPWAVMDESAKHSSFAWNIISPEDPDVATIDMWMFRVAANDPRVARKDFVVKGTAKIEKPWLWTRPSDGKQFAMDGEDMTKLYSEGTFGKTDVSRVKGVKNKFGTYLWHQQWVEDVADRAGLTAPEAQAIIWSVYRTMPRFTEKLKPDVTA